MIDFNDKNLLIFLGILFIIFVILNGFDYKILIAIFIILYINKEYSKEIKNNIQKVVDNKIDSNTNQSKDILKRLKKYKKHNKLNYQEGIFYWKKFNKYIHILEKKDLFNYNQYFDKALIFFEKSINSFQSMTISNKNDSFINTIKNNKYEYQDEISYLVKELYNEGYQLLYNLSLRYNKQWKENPNMYNKQIVLDHPLPNENIKNINDFYY